MGDAHSKGSVFVKTLEFGVTSEAHLSSGLREEGPLSVSLAQVCSKGNVGGGGGPYDRLLSDALKGDVGLLRPALSIER